MFHAPERFGMRLTAMFASLSALSYCLSSSSLRAAASASTGCGPSSSLSTATGPVLAISVAAVGVGVGATGVGASVGVGVGWIVFGASVVATGAVVVFLVDGARSLQAAREAVIATAVRIFVKRTRVNIWKLLSRELNCSRCASADRRARCGLAPLERAACPE